MEIPKRYDPKSAEEKWMKFWEKKKTYAFDPDSKREVFAVDTPPPTVSGKMHLGHSFSYAQQDFIVRFQRMMGKNVFYPFGTDDNGLPTLRLIEKEKKVKAEKLGRAKFIKLCLDTLEKELRPRYILDWKRLGMSCDFNVFYSTIDEHSRRISQRSFIDLYEMGREYRKESPTTWCPACKTAISQVEMEDKEKSSMFNDIIFELEDGNKLIIATTRPELLPACVCIFAHPDDERYKKLFGKKVKVPLFNQLVEIKPSTKADPEKGTGMLMCCTFGDFDDVEHYLEFNLPLKEAIGKDGRMTELAGKYKGMKTDEARKAIINDLKEHGLLVAQRPIQHTVNVHERCKTPIEILHTKQWFVKYLDLKSDMIKWGKKLKWYPDYMRVRYDNWVKGLKWDWCISRQIYFGIPFPVWYCRKCEEVILAKKKDLPVDPLKDRPPVDKCPKCGCKEFEGEKDIINTWATSSLTPNIAAELFKDKPIYKKLYPMTLRPQAHDIITFWLFNTVVKSQLHNKANPWRDVVISGHAQDPRGRKMSKSLGNAIEPQGMIEKYCADALRFWAAGSKLGSDLPFQEKDLVTGMKFITKIWNASKFAFMHLKDYNPKDKIEYSLIDRWALSNLNRLIEDCTKSFEKYEYSKTKAECEKFFWQITCDLYLEIVKDRLYNSDKRGVMQRKSAQHALYQLMLSIIKMMAPIMPYITEELYQLYFKKFEKADSIHLASWPKFDKKMIDKKAEKAGDVLIYAVQNARRAKTEQNLSLKAPIKKMLIKAKITQKEFDGIKEDIIGATNCEELVFENIPKESKKEIEHDILF